jgi:dimethylargininase
MASRLVALTRPVSASIATCELTHLSRVPIDVRRATAQHGAYEAVLRSLGVAVVQVDAAPELPDAVFVEDTAIVLDEVAVIARPGAEVRRGETGPVAAMLSKFRPLVTMEEPSTLDGGDVLVLGRTVYVGRSGRTNDAGIAELRQLVSRFGYRVVPVDFSGCLHLKSAATAMADNVVLVNPDWVAPAVFGGCDVVYVDRDEPYAANGLRAGDAVVFPDHFPLTRAVLEGRGIQVVTVPCDELAKAEGAVTCCSLVFGSADPSLRSG